MRADQLMEPGDAVDTFGQPDPAEPLALLVGHVHVVMGLGPIHSNKDHPVASHSSDQHPQLSLEVASSPLMDQCSWHDIPPAITATSPTSRGTI